MMRREIPVVTVIILVLNVLVFLYALKIGETRTVYEYAMYQGALENGQYLRAVNSVFMYYGIRCLLRVSDINARAVSNFYPFRGQIKPTTSGTCEKKAVFRDPLLAGESCL